jgi:hypothetical protein
VSPRGRCRAIEDACSTAKGFDRRCLRVIATKEAILRLGRSRVLMREMAGGGGIWRRDMEPRGRIAVLAGPHARQYCTYGGLEKHDYGSRQLNHAFRLCFCSNLHKTMGVAWGLIGRWAGRTLARAKAGD